MTVPSEGARDERPGDDNLRMSARRARTSSKLHVSQELQDHLYEFVGVFPRREEMIGAIDSVHGGSGGRRERLGLFPTDHLVVPSLNHQHRSTQFCCRRGNIVTGKVIQELSAYAYRARADDHLGVATSMQVVQSGVTEEMLYVVHRAGEPTATTARTV